MVEYSIINLILICAVIWSTSAKLLPTPSGNRSLIDMMMLAFQNYLDAYYFTLSLPFP
jgi:hypothetical protein